MERGKEREGREREGREGGRERVRERKKVNKAKQTRGNVSLRELGAGQTRGVCVWVGVCVCVTQAHTGNTLSETYTHTHTHTYKLYTLHL